MKKYLISILVFVSVSTTVFCQKPSFTFGVRSGVNLANYEKTSDGQLGPHSSDFDKATLFTLGLQGEIAFSKHFSLQTELNFIQKGYKDHWEYLSGSFHQYGNEKFVTNWLEVPFLAKVNFGKRTGMGYGLFLGPSIGYALSGNHKISNTNNFSGVDTTNSGTETIDFNRYNHKRYDIGLNLGGDISYKRFFFDIRYQFSLSNLAIRTDQYELTKLSSKTQNLMLTVGYRTPIKKAKSEGPKRRILSEIFN
jgi:hypothetical protein